jgi:ABC-type siderophore export system fused ATPase/permease subunit
MFLKQAEIGHGQITVVGSRRKYVYVNRIKNNERNKRGAIIKNRLYHKVEEWFTFTLHVRTTSNFFL